MEQVIHNTQEQGETSRSVIRPVARGTEEMVAVPIRTRRQFTLHECVMLTGDVDCCGEGCTKFTAEERMIPLPILCRIPRCVV